MAGVLVVIIVMVYHVVLSSVGYVSTQYVCILNLESPLLRWQGCM